MSNADKFIEWMKHNGAWDYYLKEFALDWMYEYWVSVDYILNKINHSLFIRCAFCWENTPQGYGYWDNLNSKWINFIKEE